MNGSYESQIKTQIRKQNKLAADCAELGQWDRKNDHQLVAAGLKIALKIVRNGVAK